MCSIISELGERVLFVVRCWKVVEVNQESNGLRTEPCGTPALGQFKSPKCKVLDQPDVKDTLHKLHANYVLVPADNAANNVIIVCKKYYIDTLVKELGINNVNINNPTYIPIDDSFETIIKSHNQFITSVGLEISEEDQNLPYLYWTPKLHKSPCKHRFIAGSSKCTT